MRSNLRLIGRHVYSPSKLLSCEIQNITCNKSHGTSYLLALCSIMYSSWEVCPSRRCTFHETEVCPANLNSVVVNWFRDEVHPFREVRSAEQPQRDIRSPLSQTRPPAAPSVSCASQQIREQTRARRRKTFDRRFIPVAAASEGLRISPSGLQPPSRSRHSKTDESRAAPARTHALTCLFRYRRGVYRVLRGFGYSERNTSFLDMMQSTVFPEIIFKYDSYFQNSPKNVF